MAGSWASAVNMHDLIERLQPLDGHVIPVRTVQETQPVEEFDQAYVAEVNTKSAAKVIKVLDAKYARKKDKKESSLQHLRRFCKLDLLPKSVRDSFAASSPHWHTKNTLSTLFVLIGPPLPDKEELRALLQPFAPIPRARSHSPTANRHSKEPSPKGGSPEAPQVHPLEIFTVTIPIYPPVSAEVANLWTKTMWPVVFNPSAARSSITPAPQVLKGIQKSVEPRAAYYLALAREIAKDARKSGRGRGVGAVVVDKNIEAIIDSKAWEEGYDSRQRWMHAVVAVAGDCRFARPEAGGLSQAEIHTKAGTNSAAKPYDSDLEGGPELHALMRAVELVAKSRREDPEHQASLAAKGRLDVPAYDPQCSNQLSEFERYFLYEAANHVMHDDSTSFAPSTIPSPNSLSPRKRKCEEVNPESIMETIQPDEASKMPSPPLPAPPPLATALMDPANLQRLTLSTPRIRNRSQGGYLCTDMDIYLSHEPCVCCSMGILLSRFRAVTFPRKGRMITGGLASEPVISPVPVDENSESENADKNQDPDRPYYGLHWRKQLNWRAMCFEFIEDDYPPLVGGGDGEEVDVDDDEEGVDVDDDVTFHA